METIRGKVSLDLDLNGLKDGVKNYERVVLDLGTGDGRYVHFLADKHSDWFVIGIDSCRENLRASSRTKSPNVLFIAASAQDLPDELGGLISHITINFPWGSLLESLLIGDPTLMNGLAWTSKPNAQIAIHLNGGALAEVGMNLTVGAEMIRSSMNCCGWYINKSSTMDQSSLRGFPTTWAKRLAYGRDPRAIALNGTFTPQCGVPHDCVNSGWAFNLRK
jgi:16S rRNA (adenine(1408)-N(1))-methyltransferase